MKHAAIIKEIGRGAKGARSLTREQAATVFGDMLDQRVNALELGAILMALRIKSESLDELLGFKDAMDARTLPISIPDGPRCVVLPCYNGARRQANLVPLLALLLQSSGVPVLLHGFHDFEARSNPFELFAALDLPIATTAEQAAANLRCGGLSGLRLHAVLPGLEALLALRPRLGVRGCGHTMAKLLDPCRGRSVRVVAVTHPEYLQRMHEVLCIDRGHAMLLRGTEGEPYANPRRQPRIELFYDGAAQEVYPGEEGGAPPLADLPDSPAIADNAALIRRMLDGEVAIPAPIRRQAELLTQLACQP